MHLDRDVLVKKLRRRVRQDKLVQARFKREAKLGATLRHPNIVTMLDYVEGQEDSWCVVEFIVTGPDEHRQPAPTLEETLADAAVSPLMQTRQNERFRRQIRIVMDVCRAAQHAHQRNVIHRDITCRNVLVGTDRNVLIDWGLAISPRTRRDRSSRGAGDGRAIHVDSDAEDHNATVDADWPTSASDEDNGETGLGQRTGSIGFMAPEQLVDAANVNHHADIFGIGAVLHMVLTGRPPTVTPNTVTLGLSQDLHDADLIAICERALQVAPDRRYSSAAAMCADLDCWLSDQDTSVHYAALDSMRRRLRPYQAIVAAVVAMLLALVVGQAVLGRIQWANRQTLATKQTQLLQKQRQLTARTRSLTHANWQLSQTLRQNQQLSHETEIQLNELQRRDYSSALREAAHKLRNYAPLAARSLLMDQTRCPPSMREFCWDLLYESSQKALQQQPTGARPRHLLFIDDDSVGPQQRRRLAVVEVPGRVTLWNLNPLEQGKVLFQHDRAVGAFDARLVGDGLTTEQLLAVGSRDGLIHVFDLTGRLRQRIDGHAAPIRLIKLLPGGQHLLAADTLGIVRVWNRSSGKLLVEHRLPHSVLRYDYSEKHGLVAATWRASPGGGLAILNLESGQVIEPPGAGKFAPALSFIDQEDLLAIGDESGAMVKLQVAAFPDVTHHVTETELTQPARFYRSINSANGLRHCIASADNGVHISELRGAGLTPLEVQRKRYQPTGLAVSKDGRELAFSQLNNRVSLYRVQPLAPSFTVPEQTQDMLDDRAVCLCWLGPDRAVAGSSSGELQFYDLRQKSVRHVRTGSDVPIESLSVDQEREQIALLRANGAIELWDGVAPRPLRRMCHDGVARQVEFGPDGKTLIVGFTNELIIFDRHTFRPVARRAFDKLRTFALAAHTRRIVVCCAKSQSAVSLDSLSIVWQHKSAHLQNGIHMRVFNDGRRYLTGGRLGRIYIWDINSGQQIRRLQESAGIIRSLSISPDCRTLAVVGPSGQIELLDPENGSRRMTLRASGTPVANLQFSPDGRTLAVAHSGLDLWQLPE